MAVGATPRPVLTAGEVRALERAWAAAGHDLFALTERAGETVAARAAALAPDAPVLVLVGPGSNGADGWVAARRLAADGVRVRVASLVPRAALAGGAAQAAAAWQGSVLDAAEATPAPGETVIDALFGFGLARPLDGQAAALVESVNRSAARVLAVDLPSGVSADDGTAAGPAIHAAATLSFHVLKPGHLLWPGRPSAGRVEVAPLGLPARATGLWENTPALWQDAWPGLAGDAHKYARGGVVVWSGPPLATGAARLAARAAARAGAGAVALAGRRDALAVHAAHETAIMLREADAPGLAALLADPRWGAAVVGPGAGADAAPAARAALASPAAVVLDADSLTAFEHKPEQLFAACRTRLKPVLLTPHEGEFRRLFGHIVGSKVERAREAARRAGTVVVLKGPDTVVAEPGGEAAINAHAPPWLATAGAGDVLAGIAAALLAQGMAPFEAGCAAVWLHGELGFRLGDGLTADDLAAARLPDLPFAQGVASC